MKGSVRADVTVPIKIISVKRGKVVVEQPDGQRFTLRAGDRMNVTGHLDLSTGVSG